MDYKEEQTNEIEALESIYSEELEVINEEPYCFDVAVKGSNEDTRDLLKIILTADIRFTYVDNYPDDIPLLEVRNTSDSLNEERCEKLYNILVEEATENVGMVMIFTLVSIAQETLLTFVDDIKQEHEEKVEMEREEQRKLDEIKYKGTPVTLENFVEWKKSFDEEMRALGKRKIIDIKIKKLTGRQLFEEDSTLNESDVKFLTGGDTTPAVKVDESLFQDFEDLDLDLDDEEFDMDE